MELGLETFMLWAAFFGALLILVGFIVACMGAAAAIAHFKWIRERAREERQGLRQSIVAAWNTTEPPPWQYVIASLSDRVEVGYRGNYSQGYDSDRFHTDGLTTSVRYVRGWVPIPEIMLTDRQRENMRRWGSERDEEVADIEELHAS